MVTKQSGGVITGLLALTMEAQEGLDVGDWVQMVGDYEVEKADGTKHPIGKCSVSNKKRISSQWGTSVGNPNVPGSVTVETPAFWISEEVAGADIDAGDKIALTADGLVPFATAAVNEVQRMTISPDATGGTYTLTYDGQETTALALTANAAAIQAALEALSNVGVGEIVVSGTGLTRTFTAAAGFAGDPLPQIVIDDDLVEPAHDEPLLTMETIDQGQAAATNDDLVVGWALTSAPQGALFDLAAV